MKRDVFQNRELKSRFKACVSCVIKFNKKADESRRMKMSRDGLTWFDVSSPHQRYSCISHWRFTIVRNHSNLNDCLDAPFFPLTSSCAWTSWLLVCWCELLAWRTWPRCRSVVLENITCACLLSLGRRHPCRFFHSQSSQSSPYDWETPREPLYANSIQQHHTTVP